MDALPNLMLKILYQDLILVEVRVLPVLKIGLPNQSPF